MITRRSFLAATPLALVARSHEVTIGIQSYSFRDRSLDEAIKAITTVRLREIELWSGHLEPPRGTPAAEMSRWRTAPETLVAVKEARRKFAAAGLNVYAYSYNFRREFSDDEIRGCMRMARALGTRLLTSSATVDLAQRLNRLAREEGVYVAVHNHSNLKDPNEFATPESFAKAMDGNERIRLNLDLGHFVAANFDPVPYLKQHHAKIVTMHAKDRKRNQGANVPFGQGDTPLKEVMALLRDNRWNIPMMIEYEYKGADAVEEVRKSVQYLRQAGQSSSTAAATASGEL